MEYRQSQLVGQASQKNCGQTATQLNSFHSYFIAHHLSYVAVARAAHVPCITVWSIDHGMAVSDAHASRVRLALLQLTGTPYLGPIPTFCLMQQGR
ncbi:hypothetical protein EPA93_08000 [Ktedonosporobacter rubrisoli]|uniref:Uncharacterized protein n=1 Tax=Ktedonosporobacter rubrisoli TaxID=2509675 RepID=A0A4P6JLT4_KTERU|nr:hypothetical protein [Ktedonosporobacter rubrisoli]QBD75952.1 hypothetical protein EPA93_08000 [Ktedonosporobacter rubrisoli]